MNSPWVLAGIARIIFEHCLLLVVVVAVVDKTTSWKVFSLYLLLQGHLLTKCFMLPLQAVYDLLRELEVDAAQLINDFPNIANQLLR